ncbi:MAG: hypothetical protein K0S76_2404 [Herbinix sp.]|jgi:hypothetical protein|nr:hypothetical protein [Herbinix sp.]
MNYVYSATMKKLLQKKPAPFIHIIFVLVILLLTAGSIYGYMDEQRRKDQDIKNAGLFDPSSETKRFSKITLIALSDEFATSYDEKMYYCFGFDVEFRPYIIAIQSEDKEKYRELINYLYSNTEEFPKALTFDGMPEKLEEELIDLAIEGYNVLWASETVNKASYAEYFGTYYLDTTKDTTAQDGLMEICLLLLVMVGIAYLLILVNTNKYTQKRKITLARCSDELLKSVDQEINHPSTDHFADQQLYITENFIVSNRVGFDVIALNEIAHIYGMLYSKNGKDYKMSAVAETKDGYKHEVVLTAFREGDTRFDQIMHVFHNRLPDIQYGFEDDFFKMVERDSVLDIDSKDSASGIKSNLFLGILGAVLGAALGGVIWIVLGKIGIIAGLAGYAMMLFSIRGYRMFSGFLDKKGHVISLIIAFLMIYVANYTLYAIEYCKYYYGSYSSANLINSFMQLPDFLSMGGIWSDFLRDLGIGYALSIWAGYRIIKVVLDMKTRDE